MESWESWESSDSGERSAINNAFYHELGEDWYFAEDHPVALLRAEGRLKSAWLAEQILERAEQTGRNAALLDVGCGAGLLTNELASQAFTKRELPLGRIEGVDLSEESLGIARAFDPTRQVNYRVADAMRLPYRDGEFDIVCAMDFLEHVSEPAQVVRELGRVLRTGGLFFFHTFNRNWLSKLLVIRGVEWFVRNTPERMHLHELFIKPAELEEYCAAAGLQVAEWQGIRPVFGSLAMAKLILTGRVAADFRFKLIRSTKVGYLGVAIQRTVSRQLDRTA